MKVGTLVNKYPKELKLLLSLIVLDNDPALPTLISRVNPDMDWDYFLELCIHHRVYPLVYRNINKSGFTFIPKNVLDSLKLEYMRNTINMLGLTKEMEAITKSLNENDIRSLILKGPILGKELYGDISLRTSKDLDILVPLNDLMSTDEVLRRLGYIQIGTIDLVNRHHTSYVHSQSRIVVEVHWRLEPERGKEPSFDELWSRKELSSLTTSPVYSLGREDLFISLVTHGFRHGWFRLRWLTDIHFIVYKQMNWHEIVEMMQTYKFQRELSQTLLLMIELFRTPTNVFPDNIVPDRKAIRMAVLAANLINDHGFKRYHFARKKLHHKILFLVKLLSPRTEDIELLHLPKALYFLHFVIRPFLWIWKRMLRLLQSNRGKETSRVER